MQVTAPIRDLIIKGTPKGQRAFTQTRTKLSGDTVMGYFNPHQKTKLMTDDPSMTSKPESGDPTYRSRVLMDTKTRYSELEKEAKAVKWGVLANKIYLQASKTCLR